MVPGVLDLIEKKERTSDFFGLPVNAYAVLSGHCGVAMGWLGNFQEGELFLEKGLRHATRIGDLRTLALVEFYLRRFFRQVKGDWKVAAEHAQKTIAYSEEVKFLITLSGAGACWGMHTPISETRRRGEAMGKRDSRCSGTPGLSGLCPPNICYLGDTHLQLGDLEHARGSVEEALRLSQKNNEKPSEARAWIFLGRILGRTETPHIHKAEECILQGMKIADELKMKPFYAQGHLFLGELYAHSGQKEKALENLAKAETMFQEMGMDYWLDETHRISAEP